MRSLFLIIALIISPLFAHATSIVTPTLTIVEDTGPTICTADYNPVCGSVPVQCLIAPCPVQSTTFPNVCMAKASNAINITTGACSAPVKTDEELVTWAHEAGLTRYSDVKSFAPERHLSRQEAAALLARASEKLLGVRYASYPDNCNKVYADAYLFDATLTADIELACALDLMHGQDNMFSPLRTLSRAEALAIIMRAVDGGKRTEVVGDGWYLPYADRAHELDILVFANFSGFEAPITRGELLEWIYRADQFKKNNAGIDTKLIGNWKLDSLRIDDMLFAGPAFITFEKDTYQAKFCNNISGAYSSDVEQFTLTGVEMSTKMACTDSHITTMEQTWSLSGATYFIAGDKLSITMKKGGEYIFHRAHLE